MRISIKFLLAAIVVASVLFSGLSEAVQTKIIVRAKAKDAKFIGTTMGGALVLIRNSDSGEIIAKGFTSGGTGNTKMIMIDPVQRGTLITDESTAKFETSIDLNEPKFVTIEVSGPYAQKQSMVKSTTQVWLIPGKDIVGDGIILEVPGFVIDVTTPHIHEKIRLTGKKMSVPIRANMVMT